MSNMLQKIVASKEAHIERLKYRYPEADLMPRQSEHCLYQALKDSHPAFILECKRASPSHGMLNRQFDINAITRTYNQHADAISVVTDEDFFSGSFETLATVRTLSNLPVLCKDFIVAPYQILLANHLGADAVLLMLSVLDNAAYTTLATLANDLNMNVVTEVSTMDELDRALTLDARIIGINNRNLRTLSIELNTTLQLAPLIAKDRAIISESGIENHQQVQQLAPFVDGFLVGSALMLAPHLDTACQQLIHGISAPLPAVAATTLSDK